MSITVCIIYFVFTAIMESIIGYEEVESGKSKLPLVSNIIGSIVFGWLIIPMRIVYNLAK